MRRPKVRLPVLSQCPGVGTKRPFDDELFDFRLHKVKQFQRRYRERIRLCRGSAARRGAAANGWVLGTSRASPADRPPSRYAGSVDGLASEPIRGGQE